MILPLFVIIYFLCVGKTAVFAALMGIVACLVIGIGVSIADLAQGRKPTFGSSDIIDVMCAAARNIISVAIACAMAGIIMFADGIKLTIQWYKDHMDWMNECIS